MFLCRSLLLLLIYVIYVPYQQPQISYIALKGEKPI